MADIVHDFPIRADTASVFEGVATPAGLDAWWTMSSAGRPTLGAVYELGFGPGYQWQATVSRCEPGGAFVLTLTDANDDWHGTRVGFELRKRENVTDVRFHHLGWREANDHYRTSCFCWAMYLRLLKRYIEFDERVPYEARLDV